MKTSFRLGWQFPYGFPREKCIWYPDRLQHPTTAALKHIFPDARQNGVKPHVSSGFHGMLTALSNCGSVDGYEITPSKAATESPYSYYSNWQDEKGAANKNTWHGYFKAEHELWSLVSTTPESEIASTGKSSYTCFDAVVCDNEASLLAQMSPGMTAFLDKLIQDSAN